MFLDKSQLDTHFALSSPKTSSRGFQMPNLIKMAVASLLLLFISFAVAGAIADPVEFDRAVVSMFEDARTKPDLPAVISEPVALSEAAPAQICRVEFEGEVSHTRCTEVASASLATPPAPGL